MDIEAIRRSLLDDNRTIESLGGGGPYDDQTIAKAARGSKNRANCERLKELAAEGSPLIVELGTNLGISSAYLAMSGIKVRTGDISPARIMIAREVHQKAGIQNVEYIVGPFSETLPALLDGEIGLLFVDGDHTYEGTMRYYTEALPHMKPGGIIVFDDIEWSDGMRKAWAEVASQSEVIEEGDMGVIRLPRRS